MFLLTWMNWLFLCRPEDGTWAAKEVNGRGIWETQTLTAGTECPHSNMCCTVFFFLFLFFMTASVRVCISVLCLGSGGHVDISEPLSARPGQAFWRSTAQKHRWADSGTVLDILFCFVFGQWYLKKSSSLENYVSIYLFAKFVLCKGRFIQIWNEGEWLYNAHFCCHHPLSRFQLSTL